MDFRVSPLTEAEIVRRLSIAQERWQVEEFGSDIPYPSDLLPDAPRPAAVLVPLLIIDGNWHVLFTRRTSTLVEHSGQVAFPGGRSDPDDRGPEETALREAREEIGLPPAQVRLLGRLQPFITITNYQVTPIVGRIPWPFPMIISQTEVERVFTIPLAWLADPSHHESRQRPLPAPYHRVDVIYFQNYDGEVLWGASARFTLTLLDALNLNGKSQLK